MDRQELLSNVAKLMNTQKLGVLATVGTPYPYTSLMTFAATDDLRQIIFATLRKTTKYSNMVANKYVSLLVDCALNKIDDLKKAVAVTVLGKVAEAGNGAREVYRALLLKKNPELVAFLKESECTIMVLAVDKYVYVDSFQHVTEINME
ncbi:MAG: pyridoxamine 5'-phosphate oxidase family protein [Candidatus Babeliaceae bacterium]|nr:pyridoxamine 5'-phosphate oxidase family protein [Candidatus Babeliaceae bacterium]